ncbi:MAG: cysteine desulfurase family protein [Chlamydiota bacterium]
MKDLIYFDNNATTRLDPRVMEAMVAELSLPESNPSSSHFFGQRAKARLLQCRETIASYCGVKPHEILFTSGGTEAMNLLIRGSAPGHVITSNVEHSCIYETLKNSPHEIDFLPAGLWGAVSAEHIRACIRPTTRFILLSAVNSETGVKLDIEAIAQVALEFQVPFFVDGVALLGKEELVVPAGVAAMGFSGHKCHGPKGIGFLFLRAGTPLQPLITGGGQEARLRAGTENLPGIVGLAKSIELLRSELPSATLRMAALRDALEQGLRAMEIRFHVNGHGPRVCNTTNLSFPGVHGEDLLLTLDMAGLALSHGSACSSGAMEPSRVLTQMGLPFEEAKSSVRISLSRYTTADEIKKAIDLIAFSVRNLSN